MLVLVERTIKYKKTAILLKLYKLLVRPHLDYCTAVWNRQYMNDIIDVLLLKRVQHRFT